MVVADPLGRRNKVLRVIVDTYVDTALPVGSECVCQNCGLALSPATIRNIMSDLEELGYLRHPHTSAGRVPTDKGYRFYVDNLMDAEELTREEQASVDAILAEMARSYKYFAEPLSKTLSNLTRQLSLVLEESKLHFVGIPNILDQPEFRNSDYSRAMLQALEEGDEFVEILKRDIQKEGVQVYIGSENRYHELECCSIVVSSYKVRGKVAGAVGVVGPTRIAYGKLVKRVGYLAGLASRFREA